MITLKKIVFLLPVQVLRCMYICRNLCRYILRKRLVINEINDVILQYRYSVNLDEKISDSALRKDILKCYIFFLLAPYEYFCYRFYELDNHSRHQFLTDTERTIYLNKYSGPDKFVFLSDKYLFSKIMSDYFCREVCYVSNESDRVPFKAFVTKHTKFIAKPNSGSYGHSTTIYSVDEHVDLDVFFDNLLHQNTIWILEELIIQSAEMSQWNAPSVNTVRLPTFMTKHGVEFAGAFMRMGRKGMVVDNAGCGGIFASINEKTGTLSSDGVDELGNTYTCHPDSKLKIKGFQVPRWSELLDLASECHHHLPDHKYIGWDFALTDDGWVLVEGNWGQMLSQISDHKGIRKRFMSLIRS